MKKTIFFLSVIILASCQFSNKFEIQGLVEGGAEGEIIYLEHSGLSEVSIIDSTKINKQGEFKFKYKQPDYPDFFRIKLGDKHILFSVDSTELIELQATKDTFSKDYTISGSPANQDIKWLRNSISEIHKIVNSYLNNDDEKEKEMLLIDIDKMIETHKDSARQIILKDPLSPAAYFAIYQKLNDTEIFSPYVKEDRPYCAAVATAYHTFFPNYSRSKSLYNRVMKAIKAERQARQEDSWKQIMEEQAVGYIDIILPDKEGKERRLSDNEGKVILLDFSTYDTPESTEYIFALRHLYSKYNTKGFVIYQVSLDKNRFLWEDAVENIPWICVRDNETPVTPYINYYNITTLPSYFLINRNGDIVTKNMNLQDLEKEIQKLL